MNDQIIHYLCCRSKEGTTSPLYKYSSPAVRSGRSPGRVHRSRVIEWETSTNACQCPSRVRLIFIVDVRSGIAPGSRREVEKMKDSPTRSQLLVASLPFEYWYSNSATTRKVVNATRFGALAWVLGESHACDIESHQDSETPVTRSLEDVETGRRASSLATSSGFAGLSELRVLFVVPRMLMTLASKLECLEGDCRVVEIVSLGEGREVYDVSERRIARMNAELDGGEPGEDGYI
ncbi:hypothetical protein SCHPADRAFT_518060 [Schizopora paradoxa]|uniref:Uncharacterized protein n=1 Tax=Schizopora paradoxa TaxID=27342 RepID=A0A0H2RF75_9AGAM|nr:hypothetical protein SCHPADRAFT_518060 [Schizopora paradoxa]